MKTVLIVDDVQGWRRCHETAIRQIFKEDVEVMTASSATEANDLLYGYSGEPFDLILTDMQMESDYLPLYAGEWLIEQIQNFPEYRNSRIIIISAAPNIRYIAEKYNVEFIRKADCRSLDAYRII